MFKKIFKTFFKKEEVILELTVEEAKEFFISEKKRTYDRVEDGTHYYVLELIEQYKKNCVRIVERFSMTRFPVNTRGVYEVVKDKEGLLTITEVAGWVVS